MPDFVRKRIKFVVAGVFLLILFYIFSFLVKEDIFKAFDFDLSVKIQAKVPLRLDPYLSILSLIGSFEGMAIILGVFVIMKRKAGGLVAGLMFCLMHVVEIIGKSFLDHPGTPFLFHRYAFDFVFPTGYVQPGGSYPSGHAMRTSFLVVLFFSTIHRSKLSKNKKLTLYSGLVLFYLAMVVSRVSLGEHWTSDVIGGSLLGAAFSLLSLVFF